MINLPSNKVGVIPMRDPDKIGRFWVPEIAKERTDHGIVKYMGPKCEYVEVGMLVTFSGYSGTLVQFEDPDTGKAEELIIIPEDFCYCEIVDDNPLDVPGLYFRDNEGKFFGATYEMALVLIKEAVAESPFAQNLRVKTIKPKPEEYSKLRGG